LLEPAVEPDEPELEPELPFEPEEPMFGHGSLPGEPDFGGEPDLGACVGDEGVADVLGVVVVGVVVWVVEVGVLAELLEELGAAAAPAIPETAPPAASAPATIVAPSSLDVFMAI
jgi:hypothetical protein